MLDTRPHRLALMACLAGGWLVLLTMLGGSYAWMFVGSISIGFGVGCASDPLR